MPERAAAAAAEATGDGHAEHSQLLRYSHIFASAVRDLLELKVLREVTDDPLTLPQFHLLKLISLNGTHQVGEVAQFLGVSPPAATKNIDKLEGLGLVARRSSTRDRRATLLASSREGAPAGPALRCAQGGAARSRYWRASAGRSWPSSPGFSSASLCC